MKKTTTLLLLFIILSLVPFVSAASDKANNKFGISLLQPTSNDIKKAAELVNSQGGDYGYVTLVIQEDDRDRGKWQSTFDDLRKNHLIPIVRLATKPEGENWRRPSPQDASDWAGFLNSLNWVVKQRYVVLFNEPNHATEWGGEVDAKSYAEVAQAFAQKLKQTNKDFFVMLAGFDASAPSYPSQYEDEEVFIKKMLQAASYKLQDNIDGWASHSYPNPAFSGSPWDTGRKSIRGYEWELELLREFGIEKEPPVFITETGWVDTKISRKTMADYYRTAYEQVWGIDPRVQAVTPFVFSYQGPPFIGFSWKRQGEDDFHPQYGEVLGISKIRGSADQIEEGMMTVQFPEEFVTNSSYRFTFRLKNTGQAIWDKDNGYQLSLVGNQSIPFEYFLSDIKNLEPFHETEASLFIKTSKEVGDYGARIVLHKSGKPVINSQDWKFTIDPLPRLEISVSLFPKLNASADNYEAQIYNGREEVIYKSKGLRVKAGGAVIEEVQNIILGEKYRVVLIRPNYLPRQAIITFKKTNNKISFKPMLPFDLSNDGKFTLNDIGEIFKNPGLLGLFIP